MTLEEQESSGYLLIITFRPLANQSNPSAHEKSSVRIILHHARKNEPPNSPSPIEDRTKRKQDMTNYVQRFCDAKPWLPYVMRALSS